MLLGSDSQKSSENDLTNLLPELSNAESKSISGSYSNNDDSIYDAKLLDFDYDLNKAE